MGRARNPKRNEAFRIYLESEGKERPKDIAELLKIPSSQVRKWKTEDKWDDELAKPPEKRSVPKRKNGAPFGNRNAFGNKGGNGFPAGHQYSVGHGAPKRNRNAVTTGEYATIWLDTLSDEERELLTGAETDPLAQINGTILLLTIRERRMMTYLQELKAQRGLSGKEADLVEDTIRTVKMKGETVIGREILSEKRLADKIIAVEEALTRVQEKKIRAIETKHRMMKDLEKSAEGKDIKITITRKKGGES